MLLAILIFHIDVCCGQAAFIQILNEYKIFKTKRYDLMMDTWKKVNDTEAYYFKLKVLHVRQLHNYQAGIFSYQCWNWMNLEVFNGFLQKINHFIVIVPAMLII